MASQRIESLDAEARLESLHRRRPQALAQAIEEEIAARGHPPGTRLGTKAELRARFGVATTTVNEAIRVLEHRGVVRSKPGPGGGVFTAKRSQWLTLSQLVLDFKHSAGAVAEVLAVRDVLESLIASEAARHHGARDLGRLRALIDEMGRHVNEPSAYLHSNWAFHRRLAKLCPNEFARALYEGLLELAERDLAGVAGRGEFDGAANLAVHVELVEAIAARDLARTEKAVQRHNDASRVIRD